MARTISPALLSGYFQTLVYPLLILLVLTLHIRLYRVHNSNCVHDNRQWLLHAARASLTPKLVVLRDWMVHNHWQRHELRLCTHHRRTTWAVAIHLYIRWTANVSVRYMVLLYAQFATYSLVFKARRTDHCCRKASTRADWHQKPANQAKSGQGGCDGCQDMACGFDYGLCVSWTLSRYRNMMC